MQTGDLFPAIALSLKGEEIGLRQRFEAEPGLLIGVPGAFLGGNTHEVITGYRAAAPALKFLGISFIGCISVNDPVVLRAWAKKLKMTSTIVFIADVNAALTQILGMSMDASAMSLGSVLPRSRHFAVLVGGNARILEIALDEDSFPHLFVPRVYARMDIPMPRDLTATLNELHAHTSRKTHGLHGQRAKIMFPPVELRVLEPIIEVQVDPVLIHRSPPAGINITFDYSGSSLADSYRIKKIPQGLRILPGLEESDLGMIIAENFSPVGDDHIELAATQCIVTGSHALPSIERPVDTDSGRHGSNSAAGAAVLVIHEAQTEGAHPHYMVVAFGLQPGGRDQLLVNLQAAWSTDGFAADVDVNREDLPEPAAGMDLSHFVWHGAKFYQFVGPCPYVPTGCQVLWVVAQDSVFAGTKQLEWLQNISKEGTTEWTTETVRPLSIILGTCQVQ